MYLSFRSYMKEMMSQLRQYYEVILFTGSPREYTKIISDLIQKDGQLFD